MTPAQLAALGAVMSGLGSLISAIVGAKIAAKRAHDECDKRVTSIYKALNMGLQLEKRDRVK
jgi:hypothetical protein